MTNGERCPGCQRDLSGLSTGFYAWNGRIIQRVCIDCINEKQKNWLKLFIVGLAMGLPLAYIILFVIL